MLKNNILKTYIEIPGVESISLEIKQNKDRKYIYLKVENNIDSFNFKVNKSLYIPDFCINKIKEINYKVKNGVLIIYLILRITKENDIPIIKLEDIKRKI